MAIPIDFKRYLPTALRETRWGEFMEAVQDVTETVKINKIDSILNQYDYENATTEEFASIADFLGFNLLTLTGYTSTDYFLQREIKTITKRIKVKTSRKGYQYISAIFNLLGEIYVTTLLLDKYLYVEYGTWDGSYTINQSVTELDREADNILYYEEGVPVYGSPAETGLPLVYFGTAAFPILDMSAANRLITRNIVYDYRHKFIENATEFMSLNTLKVLKNDVDQMHRKTEVIYYQPCIEIEVDASQTASETIWTTYDQTLQVKQKSIYILNAYLTEVSKAHFGNGSHFTVNSGITDVASYSWGLSGINNISYELGIVDTQTIQFGDTSGILEFNTLISEKDKLEGITELALFDDSDNIVVYSTFPKIQWDQNMYSSLRVKVTGQIYAIVALYQDTTYLAPDLGRYTFSETYTDRTESIVFTVKNEGYVELNVSDIITSNSGVFEISGIVLPITLDYNESDTFYITFSPDAEQTYNETITIVNDTTARSNYIVNLRGEGIIAPPEINVKQGTTSIPDGIGVYDFTDVYRGQSLPIEFTIENTGIRDLVVSGVISNSGVFAISGITTPTTIVPDSSTTFDVVFTPNIDDYHSTTIEIYNNDLDESVYTFTINGSGVMPVEVYQGATYIAPVTGSYDFSDTYTVYEESVVFTIENLGGDSLVVSNIASSDSGIFAVSGITFPYPILANNDKTFVISFNPENTIQYDETVTIYSEGLINDEYTFDVSGSGVFSPVYLDLYQDATYIAPVTGSYDFGEEYTNRDAVSEFVIINSGIGYLNITGISSSDSGAFYTSGVTLPLVISPNYSGVINLVFNADDLIEYSGIITLDSDSVTYPEYAFSVIGSGITPDSKVYLTQDGNNIAYEGTYEFFIEE